MRILFPGYLHEAIFRFWYGLPRRAGEENLQRVQVSLFPDFSEDERI